MFTIVRTGRSAFAAAVLTLLAYMSANAGDDGCVLQCPGAVTVIMGGNSRVVWQRMRLGEGSLKSLRDDIGFELYGRQRTGVGGMPVSNGPLVGLYFKKAVALEEFGEKWSISETTADTYVKYFIADYAYVGLGDTEAEKCVSGDATSCESFAEHVEHDVKDAAELGIPLANIPVSAKLRDALRPSYNTFRAVALSKVRPAHSYPTQDGGRLFISNATLVKGHVCNGRGVDMWCATD